jgi:hypothetical protein
VIDSLLRFVDRKYVDSRRASGSPTNGGPQPRVSSPLPGDSTLITRAPRSPSIIGGVRAGEGAGQVDDEQVGEGSGHLGHEGVHHPGRTRAAQTSSGPTRVTMTP